MAVCATCGLLMLSERPHRHESEYSDAMFRLPSNRYLAREWPQYIVGPDMERFAPPPKGVECGVYFLFDADQLVYIGQSVYVGQRLYQHHLAGRSFTHFGFVAVPGDLIHGVEIAYIHALRPPLNRTIEAPMYMQHDKIVAAISERWAGSATTHDASEN